MEWTRLSRISDKQRLLSVLGLLQTVPIKVVLSVSLSVRTHQTTREGLNGFSLKCYRGVLLQSVDTHQLQLKSNNGCFTRRFASVPACRNAWVSTTKVTLKMEAVCSSKSWCLPISEHGIEGQKTKNDVFIFLSFCSDDIVYDGWLYTKSHKLEVCTNPALGPIMPEIQRWAWLHR